MSTVKELRKTGYCFLGYSRHLLTYTRICFDLTTQSPLWDNIVHGTLLAPGYHPVVSILNDNVAMLAGRRVRIFSCAAKAEVGTQDLVPLQNRPQLVAPEAPIRVPVRCAGRPLAQAAVPPRLLRVQFDELHRILNLRRIAPLDLMVKLCIAKLLCFRREAIVLSQTGIKSPTKIGNLACI